MSLDMEQGSAQAAYVTGVGVTDAPCAMGASFRLESLPSTSPSADMVVVALHYDVAGPPDAFFLAIGDSDDKVFAAVVDGGTSVSVAKYGTALSTGVDYAVAASFTVSGGNYTSVLFLNGVKRATSTADAATLTNIDTFAAGAAAPANNPQKHMDGEMWDVWCMSRALSDDEGIFLSTAGSDPWQVAGESMDFSCQFLDGETTFRNAVDAGAVTLLNAPTVVPHRPGTGFWAAPLPWMNQAGGGVRLVGFGGLVGPGGLVDRGLAA